MPWRLNCADPSHPVLSAPRERRPRMPRLIIPAPDRRGPSSEEPDAILRVALQTPSTGIVKSAVVPSAAARQDAKAEGRRLICMPDALYGVIVRTRAERRLVAGPERATGDQKMRPDRRLSPGSTLARRPRNCAVAPAVQGAFTQPLHGSESPTWEASRHGRCSSRRSSASGPHTRARCRRRGGRRHRFECGDLP